MGLLVPAAMIACYPVFRYQARRPPNSWSGYRTQLAMSSARNWREAQRACGRLWVQFGIAFAILTVAAFAMLSATGNRDAGTWQALSLVFAVIPIIGMAWTYVRVEQHLRSLDATISTTT
jgi:uncharacterized membrane protein